MDRKILISLLVLIIVVCLILSAVCILGAGILVWNPDILTISNQINDPAPTHLTVTEPVDVITSATSTPKESDVGKESDNIQNDIPPEILVEMELIQRQVIQDRGLEETGVFTRVLFSKEQLSQRVLDDFLEDYTEEEAREDAIVLASFGLLDSKFDLYKFYNDLLSEQIAGFYDNETKEMVVVQGASFGGTERLTYAHEYTHALQDQNFGIRERLNYTDDACENDSERCAAIQALLEGDASLSEINWFRNHSTAEDQSDIFSFFDTYESPILDTSPAFISKDFLFPYETGLEFVQYLYERGGWNAVDQAYMNPPLSTEQILHPDRYPEDKPVSVELPDLTDVLGGEWENLDQGVMGEWYTFLILAHGQEEDARVEESDASEAAEGWGGDSYLVFYNPHNETSIMVLKTVWESSKESNEFVDKFSDYAQDLHNKTGGSHFLFPRK